MAEDKKSFVAYCDWIDTFEALPDDKAGQLAKHLFRYVNDINPTIDDILINAVFANMKRTLKRDLVKYETIKLKRSESGKLGGRPKKAKKANALLEKQSEAKKAVSDSVSDSVNDIKRIKKKVKFIPPTPLEIELYCKERNNKVDPRKWIDHYTSNGWMVGKNKMKDWKAAVRTWENNNFNNTPVTNELQFNQNRKRPEPGKFK